MEPAELRRRRDALQLSQAELARAIGVTRNTVARWERGELTVGHPALLAAALDQLRAPLASAEPAPLCRGAQNPARPLPAELTSFIGREQLLTELERLLSPDAPQCRLLTLTGPGGTGKTRVALRVAAAVRDRFEDGVCFVDLAPISDVRLVASSIARALGVPDSASQSPVESVKNFLANRQMLLVLDNFEQVLGAASELPEVLGACPRLEVLVTSRAALRVSGEQEMAVAPLALPAPPRSWGARSASTRDPGDCESVRLFVERARAVNVDLALSADNAAAIVQICLRLDGLPLAIELAAARIRLLDAPALLARLELRLPLLTDSARDLPARQQTLRNTIAWSYDLLDPSEQALFRTVASFVGGCTLEAAAAVSPRDTDVLDEADSLVAKSLVRSIVVAAGQPRLTMLETTREFGLEQLAVTGELETLGRRHAEYFLALAERAAPELWGPSASIWLDRLAAEHDNMREALAWGVGCCEPIGPEIALRLAGALARYWWTRSYFAEGLEWLAQTLAAAPQRSRARVTALHGAGWLAHFRQDSSTARALLEKSLTIAREVNDQWSVAWVLHCLGRVAYFDGDHDGARALGEQSLAVAEALVQIGGGLPGDEVGRLG
jgi:predicted ATPase